MPFSALCVQMQVRLKSNDEHALLLLSERRICQAHGLTAAHRPTHKQSASRTAHNRLTQAAKSHHRRSNFLLNYRLRSPANRFRQPNHHPICWHHTAWSHTSADSSDALHKEDKSSCTCCRLLCARLVQTHGIAGDDGFLIKRLIFSSFPF